MEDYTWEDLIEGDDGFYDDSYKEEPIKWESLNKDDFCNTLIALYPHQQDDFSDYNWKELFKKYDNYIEYCSDESKALYDQLPDEITIYRGANKSEKENGYGISWTLNKRVAQWFAYDRWKGQEGNERTVFERTIKKKQIKAIFTEMNEDEVIIIPR